MLTEKIQSCVDILGYSSVWLLVHIYSGECNNRAQGPRYFYFQMYVVWGFAQTTYKKKEKYHFSPTGDKRLTKRKCHQPSLSFVFAL